MKKHNRKAEALELLNYLKYLYETKPELADCRLGQLLSNTAHPIDIFYLESSDLLNRLKKDFR